MRSHCKNFCALALPLLALGAGVGSVKATPTALDTTPPSVTVLLIPGPPTQAQFTVRDLESGLASIVVTQSENADTVVPPFTVGTTDPVVLFSTKIDQSRFFRVSFIATDVAGNVRVFNFTDEPASTPEPATLLLLSTGLAGIYGAARRRRKV